MGLKVGQIGVGTIGSIYADNLAKAGADLSIYDNQVEHCAPFRKAGITVAADLRDLVSRVDCVLVSLPNPDADRACLLGNGGAFELAHKGTLFLDTSTIDPTTARTLYETAKKYDLLYLEAPVSGGEPNGAGTDGARAANITFMAAGDKEAFEQAKPLMKLLGKHFLYLGPAGLGSTIKLISNHIAGLNNLVASEAFMLGRAAGIEPETLFSVFQHTDANSYWLFNYFAPRIRAKNFEPGFSVDLQYKDHRLAEELARELKVPLPFNALAMQIYQVLRASGRGSKDLVEAANLMADWGHVARFDV